MKDNFRKFMELASKDDDLRKELESIGKNCSDGGVETVIDLARARGFELSKADFESEVRQLDLDELDTVAAGGVCACFLGGGGGSDAPGELTCVCVAGGGGQWYIDGKYSARCACVAAGVGSGVR